MRAERERRGISVQQAADDMRLDSWVIEAIEAGLFDKVGPAVYAKGHLKKYAAMLELPWDEIAGVYESLKLRTVEPAELEPQVQIRAASVSVANLPLWSIGAAAVAILLIIGLLWWKPWRAHGAQPHPATAQSERPAAAAANPQAEPPSAERPPPAVGSDGLGAPTRPAAQQKATPPPAARRVIAAEPADTAAPARADDVSGARGALLRLRFTADSWVEVRDAAGKRLYEGLGRADTVKSVAGRAPLRVVLGFAGGVRLLVNDRPAAVQSAYIKGNVAKFAVAADGSLTRYALASAPRGAW